MKAERRARGFRVGFQTKIVVAVVAVSLVPLVWILAVGQGFLTTAISQGLNSGIQRDLERGFAARRELFETLKALFRRHADVIARDLTDALPRDAVTGLPRAEIPDDAPSRQRLTAAMEHALDTITDAARVQIVDGGGRVLADASRPTRLGRERRLRVERRALPVRGASADDPTRAIALVATFGTDWERFREFDRAGQRLRVYSVMRRTQIAATLVGVLKAQIVLLPFAVVGSVLLAWMVSRGVTRRVKNLRAATSLVGQGDLSVQVDSRGNDEIGDLVLAFNDMVKDMQTSRARIEYLQRIGAWQEFARRLAHEIKNPLTPIQLAIQEVAKKYDGQDASFTRTLETAREVIEEEVETLRRLVAAFSEFAKLPDPTLAADDLASFVTDIGTNRAFLDEAGRSTIHVHFDPGPGLPGVRLDRVLLRRAIDNLVRNATEAGATNVWVRAVRSGRWAQLVVEDDGPGVAENVRHRVFEPYYTTKGEGSGLGLSIVRKVAIDHQGDVVLEERPGGGARFIMTMPMGPASA